MLPSYINSWILAAVLFGAAGTSQTSAEPGREPVPSPPALDVIANFGAFFVASDEPRMTCIVSIFSGRREAILTYTHSDTGRSAIVRESQTYDLNYEPTSAAHVGDNQILVAGKRANGDTVIESWLLQEPTLISESEHFKIALGPRLERKTLLDGHTAGRSGVKAMFVALGTAADRQAFILFQDSRDLYSLNFRTKQLTLVASPQLVEGALHVPELSIGRWRIVIAQEHRESGYVYRFSAAECISTGANLHLLDLDRDGDIDHHEMIGENEWFERDYSNGHAWVREGRTIP